MGSSSRVWRESVEGDVSGEMFRRSEVMGRRVNVIGVGMIKFSKPGESDDIMLRWVY